MKYFGPYDDEIFLFFLLAFVCATSGTVSVAYSDLDDDGIAEAAISLNYMTGGTIWRFVEFRIGSHKRARSAVGSWKSGCSS